MAFYEDLITEQPWQLQQAFPDTWFSDEFTDEIETQTAALQSSFSGDSSTHGDVLSADIVESLFSRPAQTPTASGGSETEIAVVSRKRRGGVPPTGRVAKRKPRGSKRSDTTTFIVADPENFRQMVQRVTGVRFGGGGGFDEQPAAFEPGARINGVSWDGGLLPTLDTSAFFLDGSASSQVSPPPVSADGRVATAAERLFDSVCSFPTLESWNM